MTTTQILTAYCLALPLIAAWLIATARMSSMDFTILPMAVLIVAVALWTQKSKS